MSLVPRPRKGPLARCLEGKVCCHCAATIHSWAMKHPSQVPRLLPVAQTLGDPILSSVSFSLVRTTSRKISSTRSWLGNWSFQPPTGTTLQIPPRYCIGLFLCTLQGLACGAEQPQLGAPETWLLMCDLFVSLIYSIYSLWSPWLDWSSNLYKHSRLFKKDCMLGTHQNVRMN